MDSVGSEVQEPKDVPSKIDYSRRHDFQLWAKPIVDSEAFKGIECYLFSDGNLKEHFQIHKDEEGYKRKDIFYAREFMNEEKELDPNELVKSKFQVIAEIKGEQFFFTDSQDSRRFDQIAEFCFNKFLEM